MTTTNMKKTLTIIAHPALHTGSRVNQKLAQAATKYSTTVHDLYALYKDRPIDVTLEQHLLLEHDRIIFQFPIWWYNCPSLLKQWFDDVLQYGFSHGEGGNKLHGKEFGVAVTAGGGEYSYSTESYNLFPLEHILRPFEVTASVIGMKYLPVFAVYNAMQITDEELELKVCEYEQYLTSASQTIMQI